MENQNLMVLAHLKTGKELTPLEALNDYGCFRLAARIYELKRRGWPIHCERRAMHNDKVVGVYTLSMNKSEWPDEF
jgi:hypothetical protein